LSGTARLVVLAAAFGQLAVAAPAAGARSCGPSATLEGNGPRVAALASELERRGIETAPDPECPAVHVRLKETGGRLVVTIVDEFGRLSERPTSGTAAAATLVESWAHTDVVTPLLSMRATQLQDVAPPQPHETPTIAAPAAAAGPMRQVSPAASAETSLATDGSVWIGIAAGVCVPIGRACAGALVRVSMDSELTGDSRARHSGRLATDVLLGGALPLRFGRLTLLPGLAVGLGWLRTFGLTTSATDPDPVDADGGGLRTGASLRLAYTVTSRLAVDLGIAADIAPFAHTAAYQSQAVVLPGEPRGYLRSGIGVRWGSP
jgi:hypothetical protein